MKFSIGVNFERHDDSIGMPEVVANAREMVCMADEAGFETAWAAEHHGIELNIGPNPFVTLANWAAYTPRIRLGTAVVVAPYWNPIRVAEEAAITDLMCAGRLELGIGRGAFQYEFDRMGGGLTVAESSEYLHALVPELKALWTGDVESGSALWRYARTTSVPKPLQKPHPPLWIAARNPATFAFAMQHGANIMTTPLSNPFSEVVSLGEKLRNTVADHPGRPRPRWMVLRRVCVYERESDWRSVAERALVYSKRFEGLFSTEGTVNDGFPEILAVDAGPSGELHLQAMRENLVIGTPEQVVEKLEAYAAIGVDSFGYGGNFGLPPDVTRRSLELFIDEVMPHFDGSP